MLRLAGVMNAALDLRLKCEKEFNFSQLFWEGGKIREQNVGYETTSVHIKNYLTNNLFCYLAS